MSGALELAKTLGPTLGLICYGLALLFGVYKQIIEKMFPPDANQSSVLAKMIIRYGTSTIVLLLIMGTGLEVLTIMLKSSS